MDNKQSCYSKLSVCNLAAALGLVSGLFAFLLGIAAMFVHVGKPIMSLYSAFYFGFDASFLGALCGFIWGFIYGYVMGALIAVVYNTCHRCCPCKSCTDSRCCK